MFFTRASLFFSGSCGVCPLLGCSVSVSIAVKVTDWKTRFRNDRNDLNCALGMGMFNPTADSFVC